MSDQKQPRRSREEITVQTHMRHEVFAASFVQIWSDEADHGAKHKHNTPRCVASDR
jgi:hypothetical protein